MTHATNVKEAGLREVEIHTPNRDVQLAVLEDPVLSNRLVLAVSFEVKILTNLHQKNGGWDGHGRRLVELAAGEFLLSSGTW